MAPVSKATLWFYMGIITYTSGNDCNWVSQIDNAPELVLSPGLCANYFDENNDGEWTSLIYECVNNHTLQMRRYHGELCQATRQNGIAVKIA